jgi:hypothetical protein
MGISASEIFLTTGYIQKKLQTPNDDFKFPPVNNPAETFHRGQRPLANRSRSNQQITGT